jgi:hypothetical protein
MGWFGKGVMDGDQAWDMLGMLEGEAERVGIKKGSPEWTDWLGHTQSDILGKFQDPIELMTLGAVMMSAGAKMEEVTRRAIADACLSDEWAKKDLERDIHMSAFHEALVGYDNTPTEYGINYSKFGVTNDDLVRGKLSHKVARMALHYIHKTYEKEPWYKDATIGVSGYGYQIVMGVYDDGAGVNFTHVINNVFGIFEIPILFVEANDMNYNITEESIEEYKIKYFGDKDADVEIEVVDHEKRMQEVLHEISQDGITSTDQVEDLRNAIVSYGRMCAAKALEAVDKKTKS